MYGSSLKTYLLNRKTTNIRDKRETIYKSLLLLPDTPFERLGLLKVSTSKVNVRVITTFL